MQLVGNPTLRGPVDARGGAGGRMDSATNFALRVDCLSGSGGAGYIRFESDPPIPVASLAVLQPPATANNTARLRPVDDDFTTVAQSTWYVTGTRPPLWQYYEIRAKVGTATVVYSDNPLVGPRRAAKGQPVVFQIQSARVDQSGKQLGVATPWFGGVIGGLNSHANRGNGFRFRAVLDRTKTATGTAPIVVDAVRVVYDC